jgi:hypothetical protein
MPIVLDGTVGITTPTEQVATTIGVGNATPSTSGAGITFPATQSASTNANTLDDYEEGTWTPTQGSGLVVVGAFSSSGTYTKVGRLVTITGIVSGATSIALSGTTVITPSMPFTNQGLNDIGGLTDGGTKVGSCLTNPTTSFLYGTPITASSALYFSITYTAAT